MIRYDSCESVLNDYANNYNLLIVTDDNVYKYYHDILSKFDVVVLESGEHSKSIENVLHIIEELIEINANREFLLVGIGGGVICDLTAFTASIYKRGIPHLLIPTSLLAMVDAALGGKTAINYLDIKNIIGTFKDPNEIIIDVDFLKTLPELHFRNGFAEIIKTALIGEGNILQLLIDESFDIKQLIKLSLEFKQKIVEQDKFDNGIRRILNFGHTFGHSIEMEFNILHGFAVAYGMIIAINLSPELPENEKLFIKNLIFKYIKIDEKKFNFDLLENKILQDKKNLSKIKIILLKNIGNPYIAEFSVEKLKGDYYDMCFNRYDG